MAEARQPQTQPRAGRPEGWEQRMTAALRRYSTAPFVWGFTDCFTLCQHTAEAILGEDRLAKMVKPYFSPKDAKQSLKVVKSKDVGDVFAQVFEEIHPSMAGRGDIGKAEYPGAEMGGGVVFIGSEVVGKGETGLIRLPLSAVQRAFRVI